MNELIKVNYDNPEKPVVSGRELHEALDITTRYNDWFARMCEYGFTEDKDFYSFLSKPQIHSLEIGYWFYLRYSLPVLLPLSQTHSFAQK